MAYNIGDEVLARVDDSEPGDRSHTQDVKLQIIGFGNGYDSHQLLCYVPQYLNVRASFKLGRVHQRQYKFDPKFLDEYGTFVNKVHVIHHFPAVPASICSNCGTLVHLAEGGVEYVCRPCRENPWR
jgi:hypothetical protein